MMQGPGHLDHVTVTREARAAEMTAAYRRSRTAHTRGLVATVRRHLGNGLIRTGNRVIPKPAERLRTAGPPC